MDAHELCACWPQMEGDEFSALVADILAHGVREPVVVYEGQILDGANRHRAATIANVKCPTVEYDGDDPAGFVISRNAHRRHLTKTDRAKAVLQCREWQPRGRPARADDARTAQEIAEEANVSPSTVKAAKRELREERGEIPPPESPPKGSNGRNGHNRISDEDERDSRPLSDLEEAEVRIAAQRRRIVELEAEVGDLQERIAIAEDGGTTTARLESWQQERRALQGQIASWQAKYEEVRRDNVAKKRELQEARKRLEQLEKGNDKTEGNPEEGA